MHYFRKAPVEGSSALYLTGSHVKPRAHVQSQDDRDWCARLLLTKTAQSEMWTFCSSCEDIFYNFRKLIIPEALVSPSSLLALEMICLFFKLLLTSIPSSNQIVILRRVVYKNGLTLTMTLQLRTAKCLLLIWKKYVLYSNEVGEGEMSKEENIYASKESVSKVPFSTLWNTKQNLSPLHSYLLGNSNTHEENTWAMC